MKKNCLGGWGGGGAFLPHLLHLYLHFLLQLPILFLEFSSFSSSSSPPSSPPPPPPQAEGEGEEGGGAGGADEG